MRDMMRQDIECQLRYEFTQEKKVSLLETVIYAAVKLTHLWPRNFKFSAFCQRLLSRERKAQEALRNKMAGVRMAVLAKKASVHRPKIAPSHSIVRARFHRGLGHRRDRSAGGTQHFASRAPANSCAPRSGAPCR